MPYINKQLLPNEAIVYQTHPHGIIFFWPLFLTLIAPILFYKQIQPSIIPYGVLILAAIAWISAYTRFIFSEFTITDQRVILKQGILRINMVQITLSKIESVQLDQTLLGHLLGYGKLILIGIGGSSDILPIMANPGIFQQQLQAQLNQGK